MNAGPFLYVLITYKDLVESVGCSAPVESVGCSLAVESYGCSADSSVFSSSLLPCWPQEMIIPVENSVRITAIANIFLNLNIFGCFSMVLDLLFDQDKTFDPIFTVIPVLVHRGSRSFGSIFCKRL